MLNIPSHFHFHVSFSYFALNVSQKKKKNNHSCKLHRPFVFAIPYDQRHSIQCIIATNPPDNYCGKNIVHLIEHDEQREPYTAQNKRPNQKSKNYSYVVSSQLLHSIATPNNNNKKMKKHSPAREIQRKREKDGKRDK